MRRWSQNFSGSKKKKEEVRAALRERGIDPDILEAPSDVLAACDRAEISRVQETGPGAVKLTDGARPAGWA